MMAQDANRVIVAGCGPVGAVMALALVKKGISVTLIEQLPDAAEDQRAATIHPPTVEMLVGLGLKTEMFSELPSGGMPAPLFHFRDRVTSELVAEFDISLLEGEVPYPYVVQWEQYKLVHAALGTVIGPLIGAAPVQMLTTYLQKYGEWDMVIFALIVIALMRTNTSGIASLVHAITARFTAVNPRWPTDGSKVWP